MPAPVIESIREHIELEARRGADGTYGSRSLNTRPIDHGACTVPASTREHLHAVRPSSTPSSPFICSRIRYFCTFPVTVSGNASTNLM